jgi:simple sugar transport system permease protein
MADQKNMNIDFESNKTFTKQKVKSFITSNIVTVIFLTVSILGVFASQLSPMFIVNELVNRISRNSFLVLSLLIPVVAGMGLNFSIVVGAMAGQAALIIVTHFRIAGLPGLLLAFAIAAPIALLLGFLTGRLLNKTKGQEMIASMITGFFANGIYQLVFLFFVGTIIPIKDHDLILDGGTGLRNTVDLSGYNGMPGVKYALDSILKLNLMGVLLAGSLIAILFLVFRITRNKENPLFDKAKASFALGGAIVTLVISIAVMISGSMVNNVKVPLMTLVVVAALCLFNVWIMKTKMGQDFRTVGQSNHIARVSGINVSRVRVRAITISTFLAAWGQIIFLQNIGTINTYGSHEQIGMFSVAALLVGGASTSKATIGQAILGVILFHTLFIVSPMAGKNLFGDAQIGEYFRAFVVYGVIGISLGLHAWRRRISAKEDVK